jgi:hypothetical protein
MEGYKNVFALGNAVTGRGNIKESMIHGKKIALGVMDHHLNWQEEDYENWLRGSENQIDHQISGIADQIERQQFLSSEVINSIQGKISNLQTSAGYGGDFRQWVDENLPERLEDQLENSKEQH